MVDDDGDSTEKSKGLYSFTSAQLGMFSPTHPPRPVRSSVSISPITASQNWSQTRNSQIPALDVGISTGFVSNFSTCITFLTRSLRSNAGCYTMTRSFAGFVLITAAEAGRL